VALRFEEVANLPGISLDGVIDTSVGFIAFGCRLRGGPSSAPCEEAVILTSPDGRKWAAGRVQDSTDGSVDAVAQMSDGILAIGQIYAENQSGLPGRAMWHSVDARTWERIEVAIPPEERYTDLLTMDDELVIPTTSDDFGTDGQVWVTTDGVHWTGAKAPLPHKFVAEPGIVSIGSSCVDICSAEDEAIEVHRSADGLEWSQDDVGKTFAEASEGLHLDAWRGRAVGVGRVQDGAEHWHLRTWFDEPDGWTSTDVPQSDDQESLSWLVGDPWLVLLARRFDRGHVQGWGTTDGRAWSDVTVDGLEQLPRHAVVRADTIVVVSESAIWMAPVEP